MKIDFEKNWMGYHCFNDFTADCNDLWSAMSLEYLPSDLESEVLPTGLPRPLPYTGM